MATFYKLGQETCQTSMCPNTIYAKGYCYSMLFLFRALREAEACRSRYQCQSVNGERIATNDPQGDVPDETRTLPQLPQATIATPKDINVSKLFRWDWR